MWLKDMWCGAKPLLMTSNCEEMIGKLTIESCCLNHEMSIEQRTNTVESQIYFQPILRLWYVYMSRDIYFRCLRKRHRQTCAESISSVTRCFFCLSFVKTTCKYVLITILSLADRGSFLASSNGTSLEAFGDCVFAHGLISTIEGSRISHMNSRVETWFSSISKAVQITHIIRKT